MQKKLVAIVGATATGKSDLAKAMIKKFNGVAISVDSRQIYRGLDLGTGKDKSFPQKMIDILDAGEKFSVVEFQKKVLDLIEKTFASGKIPFLVGGTGFYLDSIIFERNYPAVAPDENLRKCLSKLTIKELCQKLLQKDTDSARRVGKNKRRLIRALEIIEKTGEKVPKFYARKFRYPTLLLGIEVNRDKLYQRIDERVDERIKLGMIKEVRSLIERGVSKIWLKGLGLEYRAITEFLEAKNTKREMIQGLKFDIHAFSRRQATWFRQYPEIEWLELIEYTKKDKQQLVEKAEEKVHDFVKLLKDEISKKSI
ncbi:MAG: tRNA dimethylallyltransferase [Candidatus Berkelbacteria bacterium Licking1014_7]|uniref:tRNA dimethylallyltransferase n=1 Tax=Candidatus Berkelbacteria bacterium Licking1014_7 TaxID=2017147 RepID=A0A554LHP0_9BACT|nr:MAG: tRNA dimethylallyltransferase [Candidatus Berkelbacteria bacterium Licking1014_7]